MPLIALVVKRVSSNSLNLSAIILFICAPLAVPAS